MKKLSIGLSVGLAAFTLCTASSTFAASTGTITFNGELVAGTCDATVNGASESETVTLPTINIDQLTAADATAGKTAFKITLTGAGCSVTSADGTTPLTATPYFESTSADVNANGHLNNTAASGAGNVDIQLLTNTSASIDLSKPEATQETSVAVNAGTNINDFNYFAQYYATDTTTAGLVTSNVTYSIIYK